LAAVVYLILESGRGFDVESGLASSTLDAAFRYARGTL